MPRFFIDYDPDELITVTGSDARHIGRSLRMKTGDDITFCRCGTDYFCTIEAMTDTDVTCRIQRSEPSKSEPTVFLTIYQAFPKQDKFEQIIQKTVELGASRIVPFISRRCVSRPDSKDFAKKLERFRKIAEEAAEQCIPGGLYRTNHDQHIGASHLGNDFRDHLIRQGVQLINAHKNAGNKGNGQKAQGK